MKFFKRFKYALFSLIIILSLIFFDLVYSSVNFIKFKLYNNDLSKTINIYPNKDIYSNKSIKGLLTNNGEVFKSNTLIISRIGLNAVILESSTIDILNKKEGVWREPQSKTPEELGNMVIGGHRWQFLPPNINTFFLLPELRNGDKLILFWNNKIFNYKVIETFEVFPDDQRAYSQTNKHILTLYTCTPLYIANKRFVVKAEQYN